MYREKGFTHILVIIIIFVALIALIGGFFFMRGDRNSKLDIVDRTKDSVGQVSDNPAIQAGMMLSNRNCVGEGSVELAVSPMRKEDFKYLIPHGLTTGGHVTPIDHGYFEPTDRGAGPDSYEVFAMADGKVVGIQRRPRDGQGGVTEEFRLVFTHTCTFFTYYDLVTSLSPKLKKAFEEKISNNVSISVPVKAGEVIGRIGSQTLDYAVWNTEKPLTGFVIPGHYDREPWKIYTAEPFDYFSEDLRVLLMAKNLRSVEPFGGKIDYDIDGKLIGNWFLEGTDYGGKPGQQLGAYYSGHFSIAPEHIDPTFYIFSIGDYQGEPEQFGVRRINPDPAEVDVDSGLVKYDLVDYQYIIPSGTVWNRESVVKGLTIREAQNVSGCALIQMVEDRKIKLELFPRESCNNILGFSNDTRIYER